VRRRPFWLFLLHIVAWTVLLFFAATVIGSSVVTVWKVLLQ
jgi:uncharacterized membrane protein YhaH (DUF805 family)